MAKTAPTRTLKELAQLVGGEVLGNASAVISGVNGLAEAGPEQLSFYNNSRYREQLKATRAGAVLVDAEVSASLRNGATWVRVANPHLAFAKISSVFAHSPRFSPGIDPRAFVHPEARVAPEATVMAGASIQARASVGARSVLFPGVFIGEESAVGSDCLLYPNVTVRERCRVGSRVTLHAGCVVGADGFGFAFDPQVPEHCKIPQVGAVRIEDDVEIGACSCIDRATVGETVVGRGSKIDNLVQIAHNVKIGPLSIVCAQTGISGSVQIGSGAILAGQVGVVNHVTIGDMAKIGAQSGVAHDVGEGQVVSGTPAMAHREWLRNSAAFEHLAELVKEVRRLRARVEALEGEKGK